MPKKRSVQDMRTKLAFLTLLSRRRFLRLKDLS